MPAIVFSLERFNQYTFGQHANVESDHKPLEMILLKPLSCAPRRLQSMMMRLQKYDFTVHYERGKNMQLADTLSPAFLPFECDVGDDLEFVNMVNYLPISDERIDEIMMIFKANAVVIPKNLRADMKARIHSSHLGTESCLRTAREGIYWPVMSAEIKQYISACEICREFDTTSQPNESLMSHEVPSRPWERVGADIFTLHDKDYLVTIDYYSNFWEVDRLPDTKASTAILKLKSFFPAMEYLTKL